MNACKRGLAGLLTITLAASFSLPAGAQVGRRPGAGQDLVLHFPADRSLGTLGVLDGETSTNVDARGDVKIFKGQVCNLTVSDSALTDLSLLAPAVRDGLTHLTFDRAEFSREQVAELAKLKGVNGLMFEKCQFGENSISMLAQLSSLSDLSLLGPIAESDLASLTGLKLEHLALIDAHVGEKAWESILKFKDTLKSLVLFDDALARRFTDYLAALESLEHFQMFMIEPLTDDALVQFGRLRKLQRLSVFAIMGGTVTPKGLGHLAKLEDLVELELQEVRLSDEGIVALGPHKRLKKLAVSDVGPQGMAVIAQCTALEELRIAELTDEVAASLQTLENLTKLTIEGGWFSDAGLADVAKLPKLKSLELRGCNVTDAGLPGLARFPALAHLSLSETQVTDAGLQHLKLLPELSSLQLTNLVVSKDAESSGFRALGELPKLEHLKIWQLDEGLENLAPLLDSDIAAIVGNKRLKSLELQGNISDETFARFLTLPELTRLNVSEFNHDGALTDEALRIASRMPKLERLGVGGKFTDEGLDALAASSSLTHVMLSTEGTTKEAASRLRKKMNVQVQSMADIEFLGDGAPLLGIPLAPGAAIPAGALPPGLVPIPGGPAPPGMLPPGIVPPPGMPPNMPQQNVPPGGN